MSIAVIPAKGVSKRVPRKNVRDFYGKPMLVYSIETARASGLFDQIIVSTEDEDIKAIARAAGAWAMHRPANLLEDEAGPNDVVGQVLRTLEEQNEYSSEFACCIYATSPMMLPGDLQAGFRELERAQYAISICDDPSRSLTDAGMFIWGRSRAFMDGASLYAGHTALVPISAHRVIDINTTEDWERAEVMYAALHKIPPQGKCADPRAFTVRWAA